MLSRCKEESLIFLFKHVFSFLSGATAGDWFRLLAENGFAVDLPYWPRATLITMGSLVNSLSRWREERAFAPVAAKVQVQPPLFILGHWRHGTTHLHNLLAIDKQFAYPYPLEVCYPHSFLSKKPATADLIGSLVPKRRLQDNIRLGMQEPQEDESALCLTTFTSPFMSWVFPRRRAHYQRYLSFRGVPEKEVVKWKEAFLLFMKKLTWKHRRPIILKSPPHTARIRLLLELFPGARFVHIQRNPYVVFQSTQHLEKTAILAMHLQRPCWHDLDDMILRRYQALYDAFFEERALIPKGQLHEVRFEDIEKDPLTEMNKLYNALHIPGFGEVQPALKHYVNGLSTYRKNRYTSLPSRQRRRVAEQWQRSFQAWDYPVA